MEDRLKWGLQEDHTEAVLVLSSMAVQQGAVKVLV